MRRILSVLGIAALVVGVGAVAMASDVLTIDGCASKKSGVTFPHKVHQGLTDCTTCHHTSEGLTAENQAGVQKCGECHNAPADAATPKCSEMSLTKNPYHITCIGCHKDEAKKNAETKAPTKCDNCHPKAA